MTNQSLDTQPALHSLQVLVRAGRLTKFKGRVASIAPGLSVVVVAAVVSTAGVDRAAAQAADACGGPTNGVVSCAADTYADGITYNSSGTDDLSLILNEDDITVRGSGARVVGSTSGEGDISVQLQNGKVITDGSSGFVVGLLAQTNNTASTATARVRMTGGEIITTGSNHHGVLADNKGLGDAIAQMSGGTITTSGDGSYGLWANVGHAQSTANATASMTDGEIHTGGIWSHGLYAINRGLGAATVQMDGGSVTTSKLHARALYAEITNQNSEARATASATGDAKIKTVDRKAYGLLAKTDGLGDTLAAIDRSSITTLGREAHGLWAEITNTASTATSTAHMNESNINTIADDTYGLFAWTEGRAGGALAQMSGGRVTTLGEDAYGLLAYVHEAGSEATATVRMTKGDVETIGEYSHALWADNRGRGNATVQLEGGTVITAGKGAYGLLAGAYGGGSAVVDLGEEATVRVYGADADGIRAEGATGFDVDVAGRVTGGAGNGAAIRTISGAGGEIDIASSAIVTAGGSGIAIVDGNGDAVINSEGTIEGDIHLGGGDDILTLTGGSFTGNLYAGDGNDTVTISATTAYDSSKILDGGAGDDRLTLHGQSLTTMENLRNWEHLTLTETELSLEGVGTLEVGLSIEAGSEFRVTGGGRGASTGAPGAGHVASASGEGMTIRGDVINAGAVTLSVQDGVTGDVITIDGDYTNTGSGRSAFVLDTVLEGAGFASDTLVISGATSGEIGLSLAGLDSAGAEVTELSIDLVEVRGQSGGTFTLMDGNYVMSDGEHAVIAGAYLYRLAEVEAQDGSSSTWWALSARSESGEISWGPSAPIYDSYGAALLAFNGPSALRGRGSSQDFRSLAWGGDAAGQDTGAPLWIQMGTEQITSAAEHSTSGSARDSSIWEMEIGADLVLSDSAAGLFVGGLMLSYGTGSTDVSSDFGDGSIDTTGLGLGLSATWYDTRGFYVDGQVTLSSYSSDLSSDSLGSLIEGNSGTGYALSIEAGQQLDLGARLSVIPQAQLSLSSVTFSDFTGEAQGEQRVSLSEAASQQLRLGLEFEAQDQGASGLYGIVNLYHEFGAGSEVRVGSASLTSEHDPWALGAGFGGRYAWNDRVDLFGEASYATGLGNAGDASALSASAGLKVVF